MEKTWYDTLFGGKEKAWMSSLVTFMGALVLQQLGAGPGPTEVDYGSLVSMGGEIGTALAVAATTWLGTFMTANTAKTDAGTTAIVSPIKPASARVEENIPTN